MKLIGIIIGTLLLIFALATCSASNDASVAPAAATAESVTAASTTDTATTNTAANAAPVAATLAQLSAPHAVAAASDSNVGVVLTLNGDTIAVEGAGVSVEGSTATITAGGAYTLRGGLADGQIIVDSEDETAVTLILDGVELHSSSSAPVFVRNAAQVVIVLADGTQNTLTDAATYVFADPAEDEPNAALFSKADLTITGNGALTVMGNYNDGIASKDGLVIESGALTVNAVDDGVRGKDYLVIQDGALAVTAGGDGLKADNEEDATLGYILIEAGAVQVNAGGDAITAQSQVLVTGGDFTLTSGGGSTAVIDDTLSAKGIKSAVGVQIDGGVFTIDAADDAVHANASIVINGGVFTIASGDDGMHADGTLTINGGEIAITQSYEGIESAVITVNGGNVHVVASDDGVNVAGGVDGSGMVRGGPGGRPGSGSAQDASAYTGDYYLTINGGRMVVDAAGDGIDVNGAIVMRDGVVIVNGPTMNGNGALDYDAGFTLEGGIVVAVGSAGMAQTPGAGTAQHALLLNYTSMLPAGTLTHIQDSAGNAILTFAPTKEYQSLAFSSPALVTGETYTVYSGGSSSGAVTDGLVEGGVYTPGTAYTTFTVEGGVTMIGGRTR